jgi:hypothetical protein
VSELGTALRTAKSEYEQRVRQIFEQFIDRDKLKSDNEIFVAIERYAQTHCPIDAPVKNIPIIDCLSKDPLDGGLNIIGGILPSNGNWLGRVFQSGLYHSVDTTFYYGGSGCIEEYYLERTERFTQLLDRTGSREKVFAAVSKILAA